MAAIDELDAAAVQGKITLDEDHTMGNALRYMLMKEIPHPSESKVHIRVQMVENTVSAVQAFAEALSNLYGLLETVQEEYTASLTDGQFERTETKPIPVSLRKEFSG